MTMTTKMIFAMTLASAALASGGTLSAERTLGGRYTPGSTLDVTVTISKEAGNFERLTGLYLAETLPPDWTLKAITSQGHETSLAPAAGTTNVVDLLWVGIPVFPCTVTYQVNVPAGAVSNHVFSGKIKWTALEDAQTAQTTGDRVIGSLADHSADLNKDSVISRAELNRVIQLYQAGSYHISAGTDDGFAPGAGSQQGFKHDSDFAPADWKIDMRTELFRAVQLYNAGGYHRDTTTSDKFAPTAFRTYMIVDLATGPDSYQYPVTYVDDIPGGAWSDEYKTTKLVLRRVKKRTFTMGSPTTETGRSSNETQHDVTLTQDFYIGVFEVTQKQWELVMGDNPSYFTNALYSATRPVERASYEMIRGTATWPSSNNVATANSFMYNIRNKARLPNFDLPTEAQWEYACRAGTTNAYNNAGALDDIMRYWDNSDFNGGHEQDEPVTRGTAKVGSYLPNAWGLYDMHGNVAEWCRDWYGTLYGDAVEDPLGATSGTARVLRGGSWMSDAASSRSAYRLFNNPSNTIDKEMGFRPIWPVPAKQ